MALIPEQIKDSAKESLANLIQRYNATVRLADHSDVIKIRKRHIM